MDAAEKGEAVELQRPNLPSLDTAVLSFDEARKQLMQMVRMFEGDELPS